MALQPTATKSKLRPRVLVFGAGRKPSVAEAASAVRGLIDEHTEVVVWDLAFASDLKNIEADWALVFGGDGSILRAVKQMGYRQLPILSVNLGRLGFLAGVSLEDLPQALGDACAGRLGVAEYLMFECSLVRGGNVVWTELGLNETAVLSGPPFSMLEVHLHVDDEWVMTYSCDGLIVATPVGSTAHCLSAGGPILRKDLDSFVIAPISPHTLTMRPLVDSAERTFELCVPAPNAGTHVVIDGRDLGGLEPGDCLRVRRAAPRCMMFEPSGHSHYRALCEKLGWSGSIEPK